ncbi:Cystathionine beta-synthase [Smittium culicis]|uniref:Cystathionine beta-synthase n=1 Tax=Smittium culicis TaxID=133412 RepID=A0A1R1YGX4_9FUNG|nr:Cystathionine beta-synthase [Smittium culicis]
MPVRLLRESKSWDLSSCFEKLATELLDSTEGKIDYLIVPVDTGNTISYLSKILKEKIPSIKVVGVEPEGSVFSDFKSNHKIIPKKWLVEDYGNVHVPETLNMSLVDSWVQVSDLEAFCMSRKLIKCGIPAGASSGAAIVAFNKVLSSFTKASSPSNVNKPRIVCIFPDSSRFYSSTLLNDDYILNSGLADRELTENLYSSLVSKYRAASVEDLQLPEAVSVPENTTLSSALSLMFERDFSHLPVIGPNRKLVGYISRNSVEAAINANPESNLIRDHMHVFVNKADGSSRSVNGSTKIKNSNSYQLITPETPLSDLAKFFEKFSIAFVTDYTRKFCLGVVTKQDLLQFIERR